ncbi:hypothetical protein PRIPAC_75338 [Pristionchus pacificus]|nr:hypothetical protein PRIPAC_75338 [Pristionchus pacificus]
MEEEDMEDTEDTEWAYIPSRVRSYTATATSFFLIRNSYFNPSIRRFYTATGRLLNETSS